MLMLLVSQSCSTHIAWVLIDEKERQVCKTSIKTLKRGRVSVLWEGFEFSFIRTYATIT